MSYRVAKDEDFDPLNWPQECLDSYAKFGHPSAALYPYIDGEVRTPDGDGKLLQAIGGVARVMLWKRTDTMVDYPWDKVIPLKKKSLNRQGGI